MGRWEKIIDAEEVTSEAALQLLIDAAFANEDLNQTAASSTLTYSDPARPLVRFSEGDQIWWQLPGILDKEARPVKRIAWTYGSPTTYQVQGSRILSGDAGIAKAVDYLLRQFQRRRGAGAGAAAVPLSADVTGAYIHLLAEAQTIAADGEDIAYAGVHIIQPYGFPPITFPITEVPILLSGYYDIRHDHVWDEFTGGGSVQVVRNRDGADVTVWPPALARGAWDAASFPGTVFSQVFSQETAPAVPLIEGDIVRVFLNPGSTDQDLLYAKLVLDLVDRAPSTPSEPRSYEEVVLADGPTGYWQLDEGVGNQPDASGNGHHWNLDNGTVSEVTGLMVDGSGRGAVDINADWSQSDDEFLFLGTDPFTLEVWIAPDQIGAGAILFHCGTPAASTSNGYRLRQNVDGTLTVRRGDGSGSDTATTTTAMVVDTTYHVVATYDGATLQMYVNGVADGGSSSSTRSISDVGQVLNVCEQSDSGENWTGVGDEFAIYPRALTAGEIAEHYAVGTQGI
jgi:hypothetical protein